MASLYRILKSLKYKLNAWVFSFKGNKLGRGVMVSRKATLRRSSIGNYSYVAEYSELNCVDLGNYCSIGPAVHIGGMEHPYWKPSSSSRLFPEDCQSETRTIIGDDVWIGAQACVKQGVVIGTGAVIGAQSYVNKDVPDYSIVFGTPAKMYKMRFDSDVIDAIKKTDYTKLPPAKAKALLIPIIEMIDNRVKDNETASALG